MRLSTSWQNLLWSLMGWWSFCVFVVLGVMKVVSVVEEDGRWPLRVFQGSSVVV